MGHVRFQLDEHLPHAIARSVRRLGIGVSTGEEAGTVGMSDGGLLAYCLAEGRVLVTNDNDFLALRLQGASHAGIVFCKQGSRSVGELVDFLALIAGVYSSEEMANRVEFVF